MDFDDVSIPWVGGLVGGGCCIELGHVLPSHLPCFLSPFSLLYELPVATLSHDEHCEPQFCMTWLRCC